MIVRFTILGQPCSKANSRQLVKRGDRIIPIKSKDALEYERDALKQIPPLYRMRLEGPVKVTLHLFYRTQLPDLDESIVLDVMQDRYSGKGEDRVIAQKGIYRNDRQVREKHVYHGIDKRNPRAEIEIETLVLQQEALALADVPHGTSAEEEKVPF